ncbi:DUF6985 domain-containing protein [Labrys monachus]|uniref:DUF6985 domain-containing protein n=1 Tax=Labrys monachus TaxID=217067 RepID=A0ABU0FFR8_9HYPH|nr:hypothetical protein [Labrys monachus]MDQ0393182.1 hypothetical protein [Labrys monachus]
MGTIEDPVFGKLQPRGRYLARNYDVLIFSENRNITLLVDNDDKPTHQQQEIFIKFDRHKEKCIKDIEKSIYAYYLSILEETRSDLGDVANEEMPIVSNINELGALVPLEKIIIRDPYYYEANIMGFMFGCTWDDSHGLGVELTDNKVTGVGQQDIVL